MSEVVNPSGTGTMRLTIFIILNKTHMKHALITGGNKGIGLATTKKFLSEGYQVTVIARDFSSFELKDENLEQIEFDLTNDQEVADLISGISGVDVLVNNAGMMNALPYDEYPQDKVEDIISVNIKAPIELIKAVAPHMKKQKEGRIVNIASIAGEIGHPDIWYGITKAGMINITKSFAKILGPDGIVVNAIAPGPVDTDMLATIPEARKEGIKKTVYSGRFAQPEEVAETIYWLATDCPEYINGTTVDINNGAFPR